MLSSYQVVLWKQECFEVLRPLQIELFRSLLEEVLENLPPDPLHGLMALSEFWQTFGFPADGPHEVQGRENAVTPTEYYQQENLTRLLARHYAWIKEERARLRKQGIINLT